MKINYQARFSGRQRYGTARGSERVTRAANLPARYREGFCTAALFLLTIALAGCSGVHSVIHPGTDSAPSSSSPTPQGISSSLDVVKISAPEITIPANRSAEAKVVLSISPGFHVNANPATFPYLIATELEVGNGEGRITAGKPMYPVAQKRQFKFAEQPLAVYEGEVILTLPLRATPNATRGPISLPISAMVQACDEEKCFPPGWLNAMIPVEVK